MPSAPLPGGLTRTWFCPGVPAAGEDGAAGTVTVFNVGDAAMGGRITVLGVEGDSVTEPVDVAAFGQQVFDLDALVDSRYASAFVEIDGGGGLVEQKATTSEGESIAACANGTSREWYFATADTLDDRRRTQRADEIAGAAHGAELRDARPVLRPQHHQRRHLLRHRLDARRRQRRIQQG